MKAFTPCPEQQQPETPHSRSFHVVARSALTMFLSEGPPVAHPLSLFSHPQMLFLWMCTSGFTLLPREVLLYILCVVAAFPASQELRQHEGILQVLQKQALFSHSSHTT